ncbi:DUF421 domain-containing protein [Alkalicoccobacillus plakortidis]|uniref:DUF421 domain-containing protein n=1 Tax=Alkalicoccobacillus plakortidis TaxID=444060 RepID=A0ABT0XEP7_9BACI|nr:DUF421 domain-containing protein [Alkalicoccobacillus plakortidis]MCM2674280.1 DUF421 domain-containing protein [Alkalicoccobacillus plakortidis]
MLEELKNLALILGRIVTIFPLLLAMTMYMGKRSIGELPIFDFLIIISLASVVGADIADPNVKHLPTGFAIICICLFQVLVSRLAISNRKFGKWITFEPTVVIRNGEILVKNLKSIRYSLDNILEMLREKDVFDINDVHLGIIEASGELSLYKKASKQTPAMEDLGLIKKTGGLSYPVIIEGVIQEEILKSIQLNRKTLLDKLSQKGIQSYTSIFLCTINSACDLHLAYNTEDRRYESIQH